MDARPLHLFSRGNEAHDDRGRREGRGRRYALRQWTARPSRQTVRSTTATGTLFGSGRPALQGRRYALRLQPVRSSAADGPPFKADGTLYDCSRYSLRQRTPSLRDIQYALRLVTEAEGTLFDCKRCALL